MRSLGYNAVAGGLCVDPNEIRFNDSERARVLNGMFADKGIDGIMALRGGYGCGRILDFIDYKTVRENPKPLYGYSDVTALHIALYQKAGLRTYHTPMAASELIHGVDAVTAGYLTRCLSEAVPFGEIVLGFKTLNRGKCTGVLTGGNLSVIVSLMGTEYEIATEHKVLFMEDVGEPLYKIDRMLQQLRMAGKFRDCAGIVFGSFTESFGVEIENPLLYDIFRYHTAHNSKPAVYGLPCGHCMPTLSLPLGRAVTLDTDKMVIGVEK